MRPIGWDLARRRARRAHVFCEPNVAEVLDFRRHKGHIMR